MSDITEGGFEHEVDALMGSLEKFFLNGKEINE